MGTPYWKREKFIKMLFEYEESHNIPDSERLTFDPYKDIPEISEPSPRKKPYVDILRLISHVKNLKYNGKM